MIEIYPVPQAPPAPRIEKVRRDKEPPREQNPRKHDFEEQAPPDPESPSHIDEYA